MDKLSVEWSKDKDDLIYYWPDGGHKPDSRLVHNMLFGLVGGTDVVAELQKRGYDIETLRFSIQKKRIACSSS